jgi:hypothetical protein
MATFTLSTDDLSRLSPGARGEILTLFGLAPNARGLDSAAASGWFPVPSAIIKRFMRGVAEQSRELLKVLAQHNGEIKWTNLRKQVGRYDEWQDLKGFQAGMNRRLRRLVDDPGAIFVSWDESRIEYNQKGEPIDCYLKVHPETARSLRDYFGMA